MNNWWCVTGACTYRVQALTWYNKFVCIDYFLSVNIASISLIYSGLVYVFFFFFFYVLGDVFGMGGSLSHYYGSRCNWLCYTFHCKQLVHSLPFCTWYGWGGLRIRQLYEDKDRHAWFPRCNLDDAGSSISSIQWTAKN